MEVVLRNLREHISKVVGRLAHYDSVPARNDLDGGAFVDAPLLGDGFGYPDGQAGAPFGDV